MPPQSRLTTAAPRARASSANAASSADFPDARDAVHGRDQRAITLGQVEQHRPLRLPGRPQRQRGRLANRRGCSSSPRVWTRTVVAARRHRDGQGDRRGAVPGRPGRRPRHGVPRLPGGGDRAGAAATRCTPTPRPGSLGRSAADRARDRERVPPRPLRIRPAAYTEPHHRHLADAKGWPPGLADDVDRRAGQRLPTAGTEAQRDLTASTPAAVLFRDLWQQARTALSHAGQPPLLIANQAESGHRITSRER